MAKKKFNEKLRKTVLRAVVKTPRTAAEVGQRIGYDGRGIGRVLAELVGDKLIVKADGRPPTYRKK